MVLNEQSHLVFYGQTVDCSWLAKSFDHSPNEHVLHLLMAWLKAKKPLKLVRSESSCRGGGRMSCLCWCLSALLNAEGFAAKIGKNCALIQVYFYVSNCYLFPWIQAILLKNGNTFQIHWVEYKIYSLSKFKLLGLSLDENLPLSCFLVTGTMLIMMEMLLGWIMKRLLHGLPFK